MNNKIILIIFISTWLMLYLISLLIIDTNYTEVKNISIKHVEKKNNNDYSNIYKNIHPIQFEAKIDFNKTCLIDVLNYKMINDIMNNIDGNKCKYFTILRVDNFCEKPVTFNIIVFEKISLHIFLIIISFTIIMVLDNIILEKINIVPINNKNNIDNFLEFKNNYKKDDDINKQINKQIDNDIKESELNIGELYDYDIIKTVEINKIIEQYV